MCLKPYSFRNQLERVDKSASNHVSKIQLKLRAHGLRKIVCVSLIVVSSSVKLGSYARHMS